MELHKAISKGSWDLVLQILHQGYNKNLLNCYQQTPLMSALPRSGVPLNVIKKLISRSSINTTDNRNLSALHLVPHERAGCIIPLLFQNGAKCTVTDIIRVIVWQRQVRSVKLMLQYLNTSAVKDMPLCVNSVEFSFDILGGGETGISRLEVNNKLVPMWLDMSFWEVPFLIAHVNIMCRLIEETCIITGQSYMPRNFDEMWASANEEVFNTIMKWQQRFYDISINPPMLKKLCVFSIRTAMKSRTDEDLGKLHLPSGLLSQVTFSDLAAEVEATWDRGKRKDCIV